MKLKEIKIYVYNSETGGSELMSIEELKKYLIIDSTLNANKND